MCLMPVFQNTKHISNISALGKDLVTMVTEDTSVNKQAPKVCSGMTTDMPLQTVSVL
jgi:hypothetical protein